MIKPTAPASPSAPRLRLRVKPAAETILRSGHPWLFADSIRKQNRPGQPGELAVIYDRRDRFLAVGLFDPNSPLRVRILHAGKPQTLDRNWWRQRLAIALDRRKNLFDSQTTGFRWINGESDGWPGLVLDRYDTTLVLKLYTAAWLPRLAEISTLLKDELPHDRLVLRLSRNIQEKTPRTVIAPCAPEPARGHPGRFGCWATRMGDSGPDSLDSLQRKAGGTPARRFMRSASAQFQFSDGQLLQGTKPDAPVLFLESGLRFEADVLRGQKTGFFLDQRENRRHVETLAAGRETLNAFSFSGGFSLYAARGGAKSVTDLDISAHALESAKRNFALNRANPAVAACHHETVQAEAFDWLESNRGRKFDLVILDPPSLARREAERAGALRAYRKLVRLAADHLRRGGLLVSASCSAHVPAREFFEAVQDEARKTGRRVEMLRTTGHPPDHPATFPEANYLKCAWLRF